MILRGDPCPEGLLVFGRTLGEIRATLGLDPADGARMRVEGEP